jgi:hypothetical protein
MSDNRITIRVSGDLVKRLDLYRFDLAMSRPEFVRYCVQKQLSSMIKEDNEELNELRNQVSELSKTLSKLRAENAQLHDHLT